MGSKDFVKSSEISEFLYCRRGWWLRWSGRVVGQTEEMLRGERLHNEQAESVYFLPKLKVLSVSLLVIGIILLVSYLIFLK